MKLSEPQKLADYNLFESSLFTTCEADAQDNDSKVELKDKAKQTLFRFEKIVDSKIQSSFITFLSYKKDILPQGSPSNSNACIFNHFTMQALYYRTAAFELGEAEEKIDTGALRKRMESFQSRKGEEKLAITPSVITNPKKMDRMTLQMDNQIQLWRCSDYFKSKDDLVANVVTHEFAHHFGWSDADIARIDRWWE